MVRIAECCDIYDVLVIFVSFNLIDNGSRTRISTAIVQKKCRYVLHINTKRAVFDIGLVFLKWCEKNASSNTIYVKLPWIIQCFVFWKWQLHLLGYVSQLKKVQLISESNPSFHWIFFELALWLIQEAPANCSTNEMQNRN